MDSCSWLDKVPAVAILRGLHPDNAISVGESLYDAGIRVIEVPLNSPQPLASIERLAKRFEHSCLVGAGTVLEPAEVRSVYAAGGRLIVSPNTNSAVIRETLDRNMTSMPGFATPTEAFMAIGTGARYLKLFPANSYGTNHMKALHDVIPKHIKVFAVGGMTLDTVPAWSHAGASGFGFGGFLFRPSMQPHEIQARARDLVTRLEEIQS